MRPFRDPGSFPSVLCHSWGGEKAGGSWEDFYGPGLEVAHVIFAHIPWGRIQSQSGLSAKGAGKCSSVVRPGGKEKLSHHTEGTPKSEGWM